MLNKRSKRILVQRLPSDISAKNNLRIPYLFLRNFLAQSIYHPPEVKKKSPQFLSLLLSRALMALSGLVFLAPAGLAQSWRLDGIEGKDIPSVQEKPLMRIRDSAQLEILVGSWATEMQQQGYLEANVDTLAWNKGEWHLNLHLGPIYQLDSLVIEGMPQDWKQQARLENYPRKPITLDWQKMEQMLSGSLEIAQNEGFPFASISQEKLSYQTTEEKTHVSAIYQFDPGPEIRIDSVIFEGKKREPDQFVRGIIRLNPGDLYNQSRVDAIPNLLNNTLYYQNVAQPSVAYTATGKAIVTVPLKQKKANRFDVLAGILPTEPGAERNFQFTVNADVTLVSPFGQGEVIGLQFQKLPGTSQLINVFTRLPYLLRTPLQVEGRLNIQKQEELFQNLKYELGLLYHLSPYLQAKFSFQGVDTRLLEAAVLDTAKITPEQLDGSRRLGGVGFSFENLDYRNNPSRGWESNLLFSLGNREVRENVILAQLKPEWYSEVPANQRLLELRIDINAFLPVGQRQVIHLGQEAYWLGMDQYLRNDQLQVGGVYSLRGFNENQYFADLLLKLTAEYRIQLERDSYIFGFVDLAYLEDQIDQLNRRALGTGIGMQYGTQVGILSIVYAIGVSDDQPFQPSRGRIHLGLLNEF